ncbi:hypothetical protein [Actibacterium sp.]|uniref:hypothetical protein n=1 Tax=Actibacterium sp. TaxID=1872125 RepID=UPI0035695E6E
MRRILAILAVAGLAGCGSFPEVDAAMRARDHSTSYPELLPLEQVTGDETAFRLDAQSADQLQARARALRARAAALRARPLDEA